MLNCGKKYDCTYVRGNYSASAEAVNVGQHRENCHMVFTVIQFSQFISSFISISTLALTIFYNFLTFK